MSFTTFASVMLAALMLEGCGAGATPSGSDLRKPLSNTELARALDKASGVQPGIWSCVDRARLAWSHIPALAPGIRFNRACVPVAAPPEDFLPVRVSGRAWCVPRDPGLYKGLRFAPRC